MLGLSSCNTNSVSYKYWEEINLVYTHVTARLKGTDRADLYASMEKLILFDRKRVSQSLHTFSKKGLKYGA